MAHFSKYILPGLGMAAGSVATALGIRAGIRWWQRRSMGRQGMEGGSMHFHPAERRAIPATGVSAGVMTQPAPPPVTERPPAVYGAESFAERGTPIGPAAAYQPPPPERAMEQAPAAGQERSAQVSDPSIDMDSLARELIDYLLAFHSILNVVRRQHEAGSDDQRLGEREGMRNVLEQVEDHLPRYAEGQLKRGSLEERAYRLAARIRDELGDLNKTGADFLRLHDGLHPEICSVTQDIKNSGAVSLTGFDQIRELYECR